MNNNMIACSRCGELMRVDSRCCIKCGNLNPSHPENANMMHYVKNNQDQTFFSGNNINNTISDRIVANNTGNTLICFLFNIMLLLGVLSGFIYLMYHNYLDINMIVYSYFPYVVIILTLLIINVLSWQLIFIKCNKRWWCALIPIYNLFILSEILFSKKRYGFIYLVPIVGQIFLIYSIYLLGKRFSYNGVLSVILFIIYIPLMGLSVRGYNGKTLFRDDKLVARDYKLQKLFMFIAYTFIFFSILLVVIANISRIKNSASRVGSYYLIAASKRIVNKVDSNIKNGLVKCGDNIGISNDGEYYFYFDSVKDKVALPLYNSKKKIYGYVKVVRTNNNNIYYVSLSDGDFGFPELLSSDVKFNKVSEYNEVPSFKQCELIKLERVV